MMPIGHDDKGAEIYFRSAFHGTRRQKNMAHRKLLEALRVRGFRRPGEPERPDLEETKTRLEDIVKQPNPWSHMLVEINKWAASVEDLSKINRDYDHLVNPKTGQKIYLKELHLATMIWPIAQVLELVPAA